jgi:hypothetical protein
MAEDAFGSVVRTRLRCSEKHSDQSNLIADEQHLVALLVWEQDGGGGCLSERPLAHVPNGDLHFSRQASLVITARLAAPRQTQTLLSSRIVRMHWVMRPRTRTISATDHPQQADYVRPQGTPSS